MNLDLWLDELAKRGGSDLHLAVGSPPIIRVHGSLERLAGQQNPLTVKEVAAAITSAVGEAALERLRHQGELDAAFERPDGTRLRINVYRQQGDLAAAYRPGRQPGGFDRKAHPKLGGFHGCTLLSAHADWLSPACDSLSADCELGQDAGPLHRLAPRETQSGDNLLQALVSLSVRRPANVDG